MCGVVVMVVGDIGVVVQVYEIVLNLGCLLGEDEQWMMVVFVGIYFQQKNYLQVICIVQCYLKVGGMDLEMCMLFMQLYYLLNDCGQVVSQLKVSVDVQVKVGYVLDEGQLQMLVICV